MQNFDADGEALKKIKEMARSLLQQGDGSVSMVSVDTDSDMGSEPDSDSDDSSVGLLGEEVPNLDEDLPLVDANEEDEMKRLAKDLGW